MKKFCFVAIWIMILTYGGLIQPTQVKAQWWQFQSIDTMKYSRDPSREFLSDPQKLEKIADDQVTAIKNTGANYVAIATPYDEEFVPVLKVWVEAARNNNLHVWFRGNLSGWEGWFNYPRISRDEHINQITTFVTSHAELFQSGDIFSACPECENGGPGDPRHNGDLKGHRQFLIDEHRSVNKAFRQIGQNVQTSFNSMNADVAKLVMDHDTTEALGGYVVIDHYVKSPEKLKQDILDIAALSGGKVVLGEFGAPIPDVHGNLTETQQADFINSSLKAVAPLTELAGVSYWTNVGGSTALWRDNGEAKPAVKILTQYFHPRIMTGQVANSLGQGLVQAKLTTSDMVVYTDDKGYFKLPYLTFLSQITVSATNFNTQVLAVNPNQSILMITLSPTNPTWWYRFRLWLHNLSINI